MRLICVKTGTAYSDDYVSKLVTAVRRNSSIHIEDVICFSDSSLSSTLRNLGISVEFTSKSGWWGKVDIFSVKGPVLYLDLDTIIIDNIDPLFRAIEELSSKEMIMIKPWRQPGWASGIMGWNSDFSFIKDMYYEDLATKFSWDQRYITYELNRHNCTVVPVQEFVNICSYKHHCRQTGVPPEGSQIVCFHGLPKPHQVTKHNWVKENWN